MSIFLIRHGETPGNRNRIVQRPDIALSEHGRGQAARLAQRLAKSPIAEIWTSPQTRARMTAAALEGVTGLAAREDALLEERSFGAIRGTPYAELDFDLMAPGYVPPEGESWPVFNERVDRAWAKVEAHWTSCYAAEASDASEIGSSVGSSAAAGPDSRHLVVVSHGLVCRSLIERRLLPGESLMKHKDVSGQLHLRNTSLTVIDPRVSEGQIVGYDVPLLGCTAHLEESGSDSAGAV